MKILLQKLTNYSRSTNNFACIVENISRKLKEMPWRGYIAPSSSRYNGGMAIINFNPLHTPTFINCINVRGIAILSSHCLELRRKPRRGIEDKYRNSFLGILIANTKWKNTFYNEKLWDTSQKSCQLLVNAEGIWL